MTELELPDGMGPAEALRGLADDLLAPDAKLRAFVDFGKEERWDSGPLKGATHGGFLRLVADLIDRKTTRNPADDVTMSAYDLLPEEDRKAIAWVRENGGVNAVSRGFQDADNRRVELCASLDIDLETGWADAMVAMRRRLMPEGMEWPKYTDGEPVRIGGCWGRDGCDTSITYIERIIFAEDGVYLDNEYNEAFYRHEERVKRPAPKVLDADGVEIRVGDTVYLLPGDWCDRFPLLRCHEWDAMKVLDLSPTRNTGRIWCGTSPGSVVCYPYPSQLTHRAPVLDADGKPLREGEHVYHVETGAELVVKELPNPGEYQAVVVFAPPASHLTSFDPDQLTHQRPESWERLEEDAGKNPFGYCKDVGHRLDTCENSEAYKASDLVRRAKKLAGAER